MGQHNHYQVVGDGFTNKLQDRRAARPKDDRRPSFQVPRRPRKTYQPPPKQRLTSGYNEAAVVANFEWEYPERDVM